MRWVLWFFAAAWVIGGIVNDARAQTALHQVLAQIDYVIAAVLIAGAEVVGAIGRLRHDQAGTPSAAGERSPAG